MLLASAYIAIFLYVPEHYHDRLKDLTAVILAIPASLLAFCFQLRLSRISRLDAWVKTPCTVIHGRRLRSWLNCIVEPKAGFLVLCVAAGPRIDPNATNAILAGMLGVSAMAVQNALVLKGAPSTAVMRTRNAALNQRRTRQTVSY